MLSDFSVFCRQALNDAKRQNHSCVERIQAMQNELGESEVRRSELEGQVRQGHTVRIILLWKLQPYFQLKI